MVRWQTRYCIATATPFLGYRTISGTVWYLVLEDKRSEVRRHFRTLGATGGESLRFLFGNEPDLLAKLRLLARRERPLCIIVDTLQRLVRATDLNDYSEVTTKLTPLLELARDTGAALVLVHHAGKAERAGIDTVLGSTALSGTLHRQMTDAAVADTLVEIGNWLLTEGASPAVIARELERTERSMRDHARRELQKTMTAMGWSEPVS